MVEGWFEYKERHNLLSQASDNECHEMIEKWFPNLLSLGSCFKSVTEAKSYPTYFLIKSYS